MSRRCWGSPRRRCSPGSAAGGMPARSMSWVTRPGWAGSPRGCARCRACSWRAAASSRSGFPTAWPTAGVSRPPPPITLGWDHDLRKDVSLNRFSAFLLIALLGGAAGAHAQTKPTTAVTDQVPTKLLAEIKSKDKGQLAVSEEDGRFMRLMIASSGAKRALEIGGASGYSAIWIG